MSVGEIEGISFLDHFRPPPRYQTTAALATTYSADLVACLALLITMDGSTLDGLEYTRISAVRALENLRERVRFVVHANQIGASRNDPTILALLDRLIRHVPFDGREQSFHPKVTLARQECRGTRDRYVLFVGSRNLTSSTAWDLGLGLLGHPASTVPPMHRRLPGIKVFVNAISELTGDSQLTRRFGDLQNVAWELPDGLLSLDFQFHGGDRRRFKSSSLAGLPAWDEALLVSPFLEVEMLANVAGNLPSPTKIRLVGGATGLSRIAQSSKWKLLAQPIPAIEALVMTAASNSPPSTADKEEDHTKTPDPELAEFILDPHGRDLHAKFFAATNGTTSHIILGSANLTRHAWLGPNWEAFFVMRGPDDLFRALWQWSSENGAVFRVDEQLPAIPDPKEPPDALRNLLARTMFALDETDPRECKLTCAVLPSLLAATGCRLQVARFVKGSKWKLWDPISEMLLLSPCCASERCEMVYLRASFGNAACSWLQKVAVDPPIDLKRDRQAFHDIIGVRDFLLYLQNRIEDVANTTDSPPDQTAEPSGPIRPVLGEDKTFFRLESLLRRLCFDNSAYEDLSNTIARYRDWLMEAADTQEDGDRLKRFLTTWDTIAKGMAME